MRVLGCLLLAACTGTTGGDLVAFSAAARGTAVGTFTSGRGYLVTLFRAELGVSAIYLNQSLAISGAQATSCTLPGTYVGEVRAGGQIDLLDPTAQSFPGGGDGLAVAAQAGEVWLEPLPALTVEGTAARDGVVYPFRGALTIGANRLSGSSDLAQPGRDPLCKQQIVTPIRTDVKPTQGGRLILRVDAQALFVTVEFSALAPGPGGYQFADGNTDQPSLSLFRALQSTGPYHLEWETTP